jgi:hypothetical protein
MAPQVVSAQYPPDGLTLVHDGLGAPVPGDERSGYWWHQKPDDRLPLCDCGAAGDCEPHYHTVRSPIWGW